MGPSYFIRPFFSGGFQNNLSWDGRLVISLPRLPASSLDTSETVARMCAGHDTHFVYFFFLFACMLTFFCVVWGGGGGVTKGMGCFHHDEDDDDDDDDDISSSMGGS